MLNLNFERSPSHSSSNCAGVVLLLLLISFDAVVNLKQNVTFSMRLGNKLDFLPGFPCWVDHSMKTSRLIEAARLPGPARLHVHRPFVLSASHDKSSA